MNSNATNGRGGRRGGGRGGRGRGGSGGRGGRGGGRGGRGGRGGGGRGGQHSRNRDDNAKDDHSHEFDEGDNNNNNANNNNANASNNNNNNTTNNNTSNGNRNNNNRRNNKKKQSGRQQQQQQQQNEPVFQDGSTETTTASAKQQDKDEKKKPAQRRRRRRNNNNNNNNNNSSRNNSNTYCEYWAYKECLEKYFNEDPNLIRGRLRVMPGGPKKAKSNNNNENNNDNQTRDNNEATTKAFCACDRGTLQRDVIIQSEIDCNRALNGDTVYIELYPLDDDDEEDADYDDYQNRSNTANTADTHPNDNNNAKMPAQRKGDTNHQTSSSAPTTTTTATWQDDPMQMKLWNPAVPIPKKDPNRPLATKDAKSGASVNGNISGENDEEENNDEAAMKQVQRRGRVVYVEPPKSILTAHQPSEIHPSGTGNKGRENNKNDNNNNVKPRRVIVGTLRTLQSGTCLLTPTNRSLPQFVCNLLPQYFLENEVFEEEEILSKQQEEKREGNGNDHNSSNHKNKRTNNIKIKRFLYQAEYVYYSWKVHHQWPPCINLKRIGQSFSVEDEIKTLLLASDVDHGEFPPRALQDVEQAVQSGLFVPTSEKQRKEEESKKNHGENVDADAEDMMGWKPTKDMYVGRRDLRHERIFTIDPTTAKDLDDALHIKKISKNRVEVGVHIADVSHFVKPDTAIDVEAQRRATTVYLVDRTVPMLPRPLCEIACSLNENVERLAFSCIWTMNLDGTMGGDDDNNNNIWFGRTVIKSCARLDYATAQNIIDEKVTHGETEDDIDESFWPTSRRPIPGNEYGHTCYDVAKDVRLMFQVAMGRRRLRFQNGALALHGIKLTFPLDPMDHEKKPLLCQPYPIRDSNRLVEEFMLLANYLVAQRMVTHSGPLGVLRYHPPPIPDGLDKVADIAYNAMGFKMDVSSSESLHESLCQMERICNSGENTNGVDGKLVLQCITQMVMTPMQAAEYFVVGKVPHAELWSHFALNIPYYTHFTSPIRRYPDIMVHRLLQDTIDAENNGTNNSSNSKKKENKNENNGDNNNDEDEDEDPQKAIIEEYSKLCDHCNEKRMASKEAQERCDRVFLSLYVHHNPMRNILGIVLSVGKKTFTVFVPSIGIDSLVYMDEHKDIYDFETLGDPENGEQRRIMITKKQQSSTKEEENQQGNNSSWTSLEIKVFTKLQISCLCKDEPPIDVKVKVEGPWIEDE